MKVPITDFQSRETGYTKKYTFEGMKVQLMRIEEGINVCIENVESEVDATCSKCLGKYQCEITIPLVERIFYFRKPPKFDQEADQADIFMVDMKYQVVDLTELLRQEILLHFPTSQVCSSGCKGLCLKCGANLNKKTCNCSIDEPGTLKHLSGLKDLMK